jgi:hypothetical protein
MLQSKTFVLEQGVPTRCCSYLAQHEVRGSIWRATVESYVWIEKADNLMWCIFAQQVLEAPVWSGLLGCD